MAMEGAMATQRNSNDGNSNGRHAGDGDSYSNGGDGQQEGNVASCDNKAAVTTTA